MSKLAPTQQKLFNNRLYGFDIETYDNNKGFLLASIYSNEYQKFYYSPEEFLDDLKTNPRFKNSTICATNLSFDFFGTFFKSDELKYFNLLVRGSYLISAKSYYLEFGGFVNFPRKKTTDGKSKKQNRKSITFLDSLNFAQLSVEKMGKILKLPKLDHPDYLGKYPKNQEQWDYMRDYNLRDSEITFKFMKFLIKSFEDLGATFKLTISSTSLSLFTARYLNKEYYLTDTELLKEQLEALYGGRTECFVRGYVTDLNYYDFNSLYPSVMLEECFPDPNSIYVSHNNSQEYLLNYEGVTKVNITCPRMKYPLLPYRHPKGRLLFPIGTFTGWYSNIELREALKLGYTINRVYKSQYYKETCRPFYNFINDMYNLRLHYQSMKSPLELVIKLIMNSLFGKFSQRFIDRDGIIHKDNLSAEDIEKYDIIEPIGDFFRVVINEGEPRNFCIPIWSAYITAYARLKLHKYIVKHNAYYCDTDSIITKDEIKTSNKLGDLKLEMKVNEGFLVRPKFYACIDNTKKLEYVKIKGLSEHLMFNEFRNFLLSPTKEYNKFAKFREAVKRNFIPNELIKTHKTFDLDDAKRDWNNLLFDVDGVQQSSPLYINSEEEEKLEYSKIKSKIKNSDEEYINSDLFDINAVGKDISAEEFLENEKYFEML